MTLTQTTLSETPLQVLMTGEAAGPVASSDNFAPEDACRYLEQGGILYFPKSPFAFSEEDLHFLLNQRQLEVGYHKNIAYRPLSRKITGVKADNGTDIERLGRIMQNYTDQATTLLNTVLSPYTHYWRYDYASFRPFEEHGRKLRLRARNDLFHVDAFPTRPTRGGRILRVFTNISPSINRIWRTSFNFEQLLTRFKDDVKPLQRYMADERRTAVMINLARMLGLKIPYRSAYDRWMMDFHNFLKENEAFQESARKDPWEFPPGSSWIVYTDTVSHAVMSGQHAVEQTFIISPEGMVQPEAAPLNLLKSAYLNGHS
jgi:hypothetical protein